MTLTSHIASGDSTVCYCWVIRRRDTVTIGFTDHDEDVSVDGVTCLSTTGITTTKFAQSLGLDADDLEVEGVIDNDQLTEADIRGGVYDDATVDLYIVNWSNPTEFMHLAHGTLGAVYEAEGGAFKTDFRSMAHTLGQPVGRTYQRTCDAKLGDARCGVDLSNPLFRATTTVVTVSDQTMNVASLAAYADDWFTLGKVVTVDGVECGIRRHIGTRLDLWQRPPVIIAPGTVVTVIAGCKQDAETCRVKFNNIARFQGFQFMPGNDRLTAYPVRGQDDYDGGSLFR